MKTHYTWDELTQALASEENVFGMEWVGICARHSDLAQKWYTELKGFESGSDIFVGLLVNAPVQTTVETDKFGEVLVDLPYMFVKYEKDMHAWEEGRIESAEDVLIPLFGVESISQDTSANVITIRGYMSLVLEKRPVDTEVLVSIYQNTGEVTIEMLGESPGPIRLTINIPEDKN